MSKTFAPLRTIGLAAAGALTMAFGTPATAQEAPAEPAAPANPIAASQTVDVAEICREVDSRRRSIFIFSDTRSTSTVDEACMDYALVYLLLESEDPDDRVMGLMAYGRLNPTVQEAINEIGRRYGVDVPAIVMEIALAAPAGTAATSAVCREVPGATLGNTTFVCEAAPAAAPAVTSSSDAPPPVVVAAAPGGMR